MTFNEIKSQIDAFEWVGKKITKGSFKGAVQDYSGVGVYFTLNSCFIVKDADGIFNGDDINSSIIKGGVSPEEVEEDDIATRICSVTLNANDEYDADSVFVPIEKELEKVGLNDIHILEDIEKRLRAIAELSATQSIL